MKSQRHSSHRQKSRCLRHLGRHTHQAARHTTTTQRPTSLSGWSPRNSNCNMQQSTAVQASKDHHIPTHVVTYTHTYTHNQPDTKPSCRHCKQASHCRQTKSCLRAVLGRLHLHLQRRHPQQQQVQVQLQLQLQLVLLALVLVVLQPQLAPGRQVHHLA